MEKVFFLFNLDFLGSKTRTVQNSDPFNRLVMKDSNISSEQCARCFDNVCIMVQPEC